MNFKMADIDINSFRELFKESRHINIGDDFCIVEIEASQRNTPQLSFRFDGFLLVWCISGKLNVSLNMSDYDLAVNNLLFCIPGNFFRSGQKGDHGTDCRYVCIAMSRNFASSQKHDVGKLFSNALALMDDPIIGIRNEEAALMAEYLEMMCRMANADVQYKKECVQSLWTSMLYVLAGIVERRNSVSAACSVDVNSRSRVLFEKFIALVSEYHDRYRNVGFYADKLCLTPKYLSKLIKNATGRSAPEWIDSYVILEAKNMLKYSNDTIKEIVYKLNFPNQSVFYKFFKARTGMTPSEYRNS